MVITNSLLTNYKIESTTEAATPAASASRPSSPLGRLTELFTSKKNNKKGKSATTEEQEAPAVVAAVTEEQVDAVKKDQEEQEETHKKEDIETAVENTNVTDVATAATSSPAVVVASA